MGLGIILILTGFNCLGQKRDPHWIPVFLKVPSDLLKISPLQFISLFFAIILSITCTIASGFEAHLYNPVVALLSWAGSLILIVYTGWERKPISLAPLTHVFQLAICLFLIAFLLRGMDTTHFSNALSGDEASSGIYSTSFIKGSTNNIFVSGWFSFPSFFFFIQSISISILGQTIPGLRIPSALVGSFTVVALFFVVRAMFDNRTAFIASLLLAFSHYHIHFSRIGLNNIWDGLSWTATLGSIWWAWNHDRKAAYIFTGLVLGLAQYFYVSSRALFIVIPVWLFFAALQDRKKFKSQLPNIILMAVTAGVVILPLAWFYLLHPDEFQAPMTRVTILGNWLIDRALATRKSISEILLNQLTDSISGITYTPLRAWYRPNYGLLRPITAGMFYVGAACLLFKLKDNRVWLILIWLGLIVITGALSTDTPAAQRYIAAIPACFMIAGYGINEIIKFLEHKWENKKKLVSACILSLVLFAGVNDAWFYFYDYSPRNDFGGSHTQIAQRLANYLQTYDDSWEVIFSGWPEMGYYSIASISYLAPQIKGVDLFESWDDPKNALPSKKNILFVFLPVRERDLNKCMEQYPGGELLFEDDRKPKQYYIYKVQMP